MADYGFIYALSNEAMPGIFKVGFTTNHPKVRSNQLSCATSCPKPFELVACFGVFDPSQVENDIHSTLAPFRINSAREFFGVPPSFLLSVFQDYWDAYEDLVMATKLEELVSIEISQEKKNDQFWKIEMFLSQEADPMVWPKSKIKLL